MAKSGGDINWVIGFMYYVAGFLGVCTLTFDQKKRVLCESRARNLLRTVVYGAAIMLTIPLSYMASRRMEMNGTVIKDFASIIDVINGIIRVFSSTVSVVALLKNRHNIVKFFNNILKLNETMRKEAKIEKWFHWMILTKVVVGNSAAIAITVIFFMNFNKFSLIILAAFWSQIEVLIFQQFSMYCFYIAVAFICKFYKMTNYQLFEVYAQYKAARRSGIAKEKCFLLSDRVDELAALYKELFDLHNFIKKVYEVSVLTSLVTSFCTNVSFSFATYTLVHRKSVNSTAVAIYLSTTVLSFIDTYLTASVCDAHGQFFREAKHILGIFGDTKSIDVRLDRTVSTTWFDLRLCISTYKKFQIERVTFQMEKQSISYRLWGLLEINQQTSFMFLTGYLSCLIILAQFDYIYGDLDLNTLKNNIFEK